ncbi:glutamyl-tRNA(Gln) amidotransferase, C subunit [Spirochaeta thermophila DSM 6578]|uniref:Aspartyl/glutamyl-tRNA(Asn/Gln) amidotransferase subunit C n=1 Tax=Winmispira thermophila (strain ATCC 700085 / DSM 6578 / Z-1203) TaxID=869211 RepID=G0GG45_WINT7|nr:Asp-tRNA(Asn)/Glu-tRNA(Gln) amidotransferase subunit GatC [Spirochaeta thermophila]AEJ62521.1 glutamyl-tRNA(Gln) amidotransferase, C subunit [Spirochaeta thermophila DSM 6578]
MQRKELEITAELAALELSEEEFSRLQEEVEQMLRYFETMDELEVEDVPPTTHAFIRKNRLRKDVSIPWENRDVLLENAPEVEDRFIVIPNVL